MGLFGGSSKTETLVPSYARACMTLDAVEVRNTRYMQDVVVTLEPFTPLVFRIVRESNKFVPDDWDFVPGSLFVLTDDHRFCGQLDPVQVKQHGFAAGTKMRGVVLAPTNAKGVVGKSTSVADLWEVWLYPAGTPLDRAF